MKNVVQEVLLFVAIVRDELRKKLVGTEKLKIPTINLFISRFYSLTIIVYVFRSYRRLKPADKIKFLLVRLTY